MSKYFFHLGRLELALDLLEKQELLRCGSSSQESSIPFAVTVRELLHHKNAGNEAYQSGRHSEAVEHYTAVVSNSIESRPFAAICFCNRAAANQALAQIVDAIADCSIAIALDGSYSKAVSRRATLHETIRDYKQAASDLQRLISLLKKQWQEKVRQSGTPDRTTDSNVKELTKAHRRLHSVEEKAKKGTSLDHYLILYVFLFRVLYDFFYLFPWPWISIMHLDNINFA
ncbi:Mitochondrial import receptor subunit like [Actinidia chinensis var. chinensis]|uniref:Mitochondrial import receptor subunit like n=1 Tax=Actinidia chinensis var. chinensis TaxID=1590841 RepID=A0A2R6RU37_ACTCC|nr:Mitochondrial import receptor subunit like [Actinidia chinensis var. chinensis]